MWSGSSLWSWFVSLMTYDTKHFCMFIGYLHITLENVYLAPLTIFQLRSFSYWVVRVLYIPDCCCCSVSKSCPALWNPWTATRQAPLSFTVSQSLLKFMFIELVMLSNHFILLHLCLLLLLIFPSIRVFSNESILHIRWPKYRNFSFSITPFSEYSGLISFRIDWFDLLAVQGTRVFSSSTILKHQFFGTQSSLWFNSHIQAGNTIALTIQTFVSKAMSLLINTLSRFVIAFFQGASTF